MNPLQRLALVCLAALLIVIWPTQTKADQVVCSTNGAGIDSCDIFVPNVIDASTDYPALMFFPGDVVTVSANGCVQTGGTGKTWKHYVVPSGNNSSSLYHGLISIPGATADLVRISTLTAPVTVTSAGFLRLGYEDDSIGDNGYWSPDLGTEDQCANPNPQAGSSADLGKARIHLDIKRAGPAFQQPGMYGECISISATLDRCRIDRPDVTLAEESYPSIVFKPGDTVTIDAGGCAQTGGTGKTWKDYLNPLGPNATDVVDDGKLIKGLYRGLISIPGVTSGLERISKFVGAANLPASTGGTLLLGYEDEWGGYRDNGYWSHDDGTDDQCKGKGPAFVQIDITRAPTPPGDHVNLDALEITQSVQNVSQTVPLVAGKVTFARAYLTRVTVPGPVPPAPLTVSGILRATLANGTSIDVNSQAPVLLLSNETLRTRRENLNRSLNFLLPTSVIAAGKVRFQLIAITSTAGMAITCNGCATGLPAEFLRSAELRVTAIGLTYTDSKGATFTPTVTDLQFLGSWLRRAYPTAEPDYGIRTVVANDGWPFSCDDANDQIAAIRGNDMSNGDNPRVHYYGMVADGGGFMQGCASSVPDDPNPAVVASGPAGPTNQNITNDISGVRQDFDASYGDWYGGHELGHTFGRSHPGFCFDNSADDHAFPFPNGQISDSQGSYVGFDAGDFVLGLPTMAFSGVTTFDVMTYCMPLWVSAYNYQAIRQRLIDEDAGLGGPEGQGSAGASGRGSRTEFGGALIRRVRPVRDLRPLSAPNLVQVIAQLDLTQMTGKFRYLTPVRSGPPSAKATANRVSIQAISTDRHIVRSYSAPFQISTDKRPGQHRTAMVDTTIQIDPRTTRLALFLGGKKLDEFQSLFSPPQSPQGARIVTRLEGAGTERKRTYLLEWAPSHPRPGETITYIVEMLEDSHWQTIGIGRRPTRLSLTAAQAHMPRLRVTATNGFRNSESFTISGVQ